MGVHLGQFGTTAFSKTGMPYNESEKNAEMQEIRKLRKITKTRKELVILQGQEPTIQRGLRLGYY